ncbi:flagellin [Bacillus sp. SCS-153A]|uniref:flagellin n=1 Tax=Rossellomorea sedimentorum TaxID=3115294 RepID=UPI003905B9E3
MGFFLRREALFLFGGGIVIMKNQTAKRVNIVSLKLVKESSMLYKNRSVRSPKDGYQLLKQFLGDVDREHFVVVCLDTKNQPTAINICHIGSLNASIVHPRECFKPDILSNAASILVGHNHPSGNNTADDSTAKADVLVDILDAAIVDVSTKRSSYGAAQNRLEHSINNLNTSSENLTAAESRIRDVDMAKEMMNQTKNSILSQAAQAMLAQANQQPQGVLQLLR